MYFSTAPRAVAGPRSISYGVLPWSQLVDALLAAYSFRPPGNEGKINGPMISPATFVEGATKAEANVTGVHWLMLDFDDVRPSDFLSVLGRLEAEGIAAFCYSTWSQPEAARTVAADGTPDPRIRARVGMPISRPCSPQEWRSVYFAALVKYGASGSDATCSDPSRFYFTPSLPIGSDVFAQTWRASGVGAVDVETLVRDFGRALPARHVGANRLGPGDPIPRDTLVRLAAKLSRSLKTETLRAGQFLTSALNGHAFAAIGQRHASKLTLSMHIAAAFPTGNANQIAEYFRASFELMRDGTEREDPVDKFAGLIESAQAKVSADLAAHEQQRAVLAQTLIVKAWEGQGFNRAEPYTSGELAAAASALGLCDQSELSSRWLVQCGDWVHVLFLHPVNGPSYLPACSKTAVTTSIAQNLAPAVAAGFSSHKLARDGSPVLKPFEQLISEYGRVVSREEMSMLAPRSYLDAKRSCIVEATTPLVKMEPEYDDEVDFWLALLAGDHAPTCVASRAARGTKAARLCDWLAVVTDLSEAAPALFFRGGPGSGKTMFAIALAMLWGAKTPTSLSNVIGNTPFNEALMRCPLVLGDEKVPESMRGEPKTEELRELITKDNFELNRKNRNLITLTGSVRVILAANNFNMILRKGEFTPEDAQALADRFILIEPHPLAAKFLADRGGRPWTNTLTLDGRLLRHVHWLRAQHEAGIRPIERGTRLYVPGDASLLTDVLQTATRTPWAICFWLWQFLQNPATHVSASSGRPLGALVADGALWVSSEHLVLAWDHYLQGERPPSREVLQSALRNVTAARDEGGRLRRNAPAPPHGGRAASRVDYRQIRIEALVQWATRNGEDTRDLAIWLSVQTEALGTPGNPVPWMSRPN